MRVGSRHVPVSPGRPGGPVSPGRPGRSTAGRHGPSGLDALERLAEPVARAAGMDLESVQLTSAGRRRLLRVVVDAVGGVGLDDIALVSQALSETLDAAEAMGDAPYTLEVTSPGVDRPLTRPEHWRRAVGRMVSVPLTGPSAAGTGSAARAWNTGGGGAIVAGGPGDGASGPARAGGSGDGVGGSARAGGPAGSGDRAARHPVRGRIVAAGEDGVVVNVDGERREFGFAELGPGKVQVEFRREDMGESRGY